MKKLILASCLCLFMANLFAQQGFHAGLKFIPQTVWTINKQWSDDPDFRYQNRYRFAFGGSFNYHFSDGVGVGIDLLYSMQGQRFHTRAGNEFDLDLNYLKIPVLLHWNTSSENVVMFTGYVGPQFAFRTSAELDLFGIDIEDYFKPVNIGLALGLGAGFNITDYLVATVGIRLDGGLTDAGESDMFVDEARTWVLTGGLPEIGIKYVLRTD